MVITFKPCLHVQKKKERNLCMMQKSKRITSKYVKNWFLITLILPTKLIASSNWTGFFFWGGVSSSRGKVIAYPFGKNVLKPKIRSRWPLNSCFTLATTPTVSILQTDNINTDHSKLKKIPLNSIGKEKKVHIILQPNLWALNSFMTSRKSSYFSLLFRKMSFTFLRYSRASFVVSFWILPPPIIWLCTVLHFQRNRQKNRKIC